MADSFTHLLPQVIEARQRRLPGSSSSSSTNEPVLFVAFIKETSLKRFLSSWRVPAAKGGMNIHVVLSPKHLGWDQLGLHALEVTKVRKVLAFGGGKAILGEVTQAPVTPRLVRFEREEEEAGSAEVARGGATEGSVTYLVMNVTRVVEGKIEKPQLLKLLH